MTQFQAPPSSPSCPAPRRRTLPLALLAVTTSAACFSTPKDPPDAGPGSGAPAAQEVTCPATVAGEMTALTASERLYTPNSLTIKRGQVVRFIMKEDHTATHNASPTGLFNIFLGGDTQCVRFNTAGDYLVGCLAHGFTGHVIVQ